MSKFKIIKLTNLSPFHIGVGRDYYDFSSDILHSDTISSAIASIRARRGKTDDLEKFLSSFKISSAFPFYKDTLYLPLPKGKLNIKVKGKKEDEMRKNLKKLKFADLTIWQKIAKGEVIEIEESQINEIYLNEPSSSNRKQFRKKILTERVAVPSNQKEKAVPFFFEWTFYDKNAGLYFITDSNEQTFQEIKDLMIELGENGIGSDKNIGGGHFDCDDICINIEDVEGANAQIILSLFIPTKEDVMNLNLKESQYSLVKRGGFIAGSTFDSFKHLRKKSVYMFEEGSIFYTTKTMNGKIVDLKPIWNDSKMHKVLRSGRTLSIPIII